METYLTPWGIFDVAELTEASITAEQTDPVEAEKMYQYACRLREDRIQSEDLERSKRRPCPGGCGEAEYYCLCR